MSITMADLINAGPIPLLSLIAYFLYRMDKAQAIIEAGQKTRDAKLDIMHQDLRGVINKLANIQHEQRKL